MTDTIYTHEGDLSGDTWKHTQDKSGIRRQGKEKLNTTHMTQRTAKIKQEVTCTPRVRQGHTGLTPRQGYTNMETHNRLGKMMTEREKNMETDPET